MRAPEQTDLGDREKYRSSGARPAWNGVWDRPREDEVENLLREAWPRPLCNRH